MKYLKKVSDRGLVLSTKLKQLCTEPMIKRYKMVEYRT